MMKLWEAKAKLKNKKGFTLIELIVVVAIIAILIALLVPNVMRFIQQASDTAADANAKAVYVAVNTYMANEYAQGQEVGAGNYAAGDNSDVIKGVGDLLATDAASGVYSFTISKTGDKLEVTDVVWRAKAGDTVVGNFPKVP